VHSPAGSTDGTTWQCHCSPSCLSWMDEAAVKHHIELVNIEVGDPRS
jgi:hypothetical protein